MGERSRKAPKNMYVIYIPTERPGCEEVDNGNQSKQILPTTDLLLIYAKIERTVLLIPFGAESQRNYEHSALKKADWFYLAVDMKDVSMQANTKRTSPWLRGNLSMNLAWPGPVPCCF